VDPASGNGAQADGGGGGALTPSVVDKTSDGRDNPAAEPDARAAA